MSKKLKKPKTLKQKSPTTILVIHLLKAIPKQREFKKEKEEMGKLR